MAQVTLCLGIRKAFYELTAHYYNYMVPCDRNTSHCNAKRRANGGRNHTHPLGKQSHPSILSYSGWVDGWMDGRSGLLMKY